MGHKGAGRQERQDPTLLIVVVARRPQGLKQKRSGSSGTQHFDTRGGWQGLEHKGIGRWGRQGPALLILVAAGLSQGLKQKRGGSGGTQHF